LGRAFILPILGSNQLFYFLLGYSSRGQVLKGGKEEEGIGEPFFRLLFNLLGN